MIYRGPDFLAVPPSTPPSSLPSVCWTGDTQEDCERDKLLTGEGKGVARGAKSYDRKKAWTSINHSILSVYQY